MVFITVHCDLPGNISQAAKIAVNFLGAFQLFPSHCMSDNSFFQCHGSVCRQVSAHGRCCRNNRNRFFRFPDTWDNFVMP